jgi:hypothetical protein
MRARSTDPHRRFVGCNRLGHILWCAPRLEPTQISRPVAAGRKNRVQVRVGESGL